MAAAQLKLFIVDDDPDLVAVMRAMLEKAGHQVRTSHDSTEALKTIAADPPDAVITDMMMPRIDGLELCKRLRDNPALNATRIIILTTKAYESDEKRAFERGADGWLLKPVREKELVARVEQIVSDRIQLGFYGVRGTLPVPGPGSLRYGGNTNCVTLRFPRGQLFIFDAGSGIKTLSDSLLAEGKTRLKGTILISHPHWDHINALPFFKHLYIPGNSFEICGANSYDLDVSELVTRQMDGTFFPVTIQEFGAHTRFRELEEGEHDIAGITVKTMRLNHPGTCIGYRVEYAGRSLCYVTDNELYPEGSDLYSQSYRDRLIDFVRGCDALITDSTYTDEEYASKMGWGHSSIGEVVSLAHAAAVKTLYLYHHDPDQDDDAIDRKLQTARALLSERGSETACEAPAEGDSLWL